MNVVEEYMTAYRELLLQPPGSAVGMLIEEQLQDVWNDMSAAECIACMHEVMALAEGAVS